MTEMKKNPTLHGRVSKRHPLGNRTNIEMVNTTKKSLECGNVLYVKLSKLDIGETNNALREVKDILGDKNVSSRIKKPRYMYISMENVSPISRRNGSNKENKSAVKSTEHNLNKNHNMEAKHIENGGEQRGKPCLELNSSTEDNPTVIPIKKCPGNKVFNKTKNCNKCIITTNRIRKKRTCLCNCDGELSAGFSKNVMTMNEYSSGTNLNLSNICSRENVGNKIFHDKKFTSQCKVKLIRMDISQLLKKPSQDDIVVDSKSIPSQALTDEKHPENKKVSFLKSTDDKLNNKLSVPTPQRSLRKQIKPNYAEVTLDTSQKEVPELHQVAAKVPVYRQCFEDKTANKSNSPYKFDESDSDKENRAKKRKNFHKKPRKSEESYSIHQKHNTKRKKVNAVRTTKKPTRKYNDIVQEVIHRVMGKVHQASKNVNVIKTDKLPITAKTQRPTTGIDNTEKALIQIPLAKSKKNIYDEKVVPVVDDKIRASPVKPDLPHNKEYVTLRQVQTIMENIQIQNKLGEHKSIVDINNISGSFEISLESIIYNQDNLNKDDKGNETTPEINVAKENSSLIKEHIPQHTYVDKSQKSSELSRKIEEVPENNESIVGGPAYENINVDESFHEANDAYDESISDEDVLNESFLDFGGNFHSTPLKNTPKINVLSDVVVHEKYSAEKHNPWRFNENVIRNPHFIVLKNTALPCLKQDMVLDHTQLEKIEEHFSKTPRRIGTPKKSPVQKSLLHYINSSNRQDQENILRLSLFNEEEFSPIKFQLPKQNVLKNKAKRNVLASIQDNRSNIITSTPITVPPRKSLATNVNEDIANYFDFENNISVRDKGRNSESRPFRIKNYGKKHPNTPQEREQEEEGAELEDLSFPKFEESRDATDNTNIQLFEDLEKDFTLNVPSKIYERKPRRKRLKCVEVENEEEHPKKRKKDMMTKAEEAALEEWAQKFNSMCREVENYNLEID